VFNKTNVWAVGELYINDSTGKPDMSNPYNASHWDGNKWTLIKVPTELYGGAILYAPIYTIFAFSETNIWTFNVAGSYSHWDGTSWNTHYVPARSGGGNKLWGSDPSNLYLVGTDGSISHCNGSSWTQMSSNTTVDLQDVWGADANHIWATGTNDVDGHSIVLQCDGTNWTTIYDNNVQSTKTDYTFATAWSDNLSFLYMDGGSGLHILTSSNANIGPQIKTGLTYAATCIRGVNQNDLFDVSAGGEIAHYNGSSWHLYPEVQSLNGNVAWWYCVHPTTDFIAIGGLYFTGFNSLPVVLRGYR
jgi:hypothetical protein